MPTPTQTRTRTWTYADLARMPESQDGRRHEIIDGELIVTPSAVPLHQLVDYRLARQIGNHSETMVKKVASARCSSLRSMSDSATKR